ncbi:STAS domain-containing protein [Streptomyces sp. NBC_00199]|uniref:STAS domain-containing protein n=1 Tax=Streptomyces sp. NBC_00199 TaxID=2975678 RepID=UPI002255F54D|nr:STAS domain-containing protein [Streptomyces sp. NBC_00199]MCX5264634.1 STAS domain-containing protein [Streptomyces sp. NBC_00199]
MTDNQETGRSDRLSVEHASVGDIRVVILRGEIDHDVKDALSEALLSRNDDQGHRIVADLSGVTFLDSSGINVFVQVHQHVSAADGWLRLAAAQESVARVVQLVGLDAVLSCHSTVEQALTA